MGCGAKPHEPSLSYSIVDCIERFCVLSSIKNEDSYGYKIVRDIQPYISISESTLYPILRRLESAEMLTVYSVEHNGRLRKYYRINEKGLERLREFEDEWKEIEAVRNYITRTE